MRRWGWIIALFVLLAGTAIAQMVMRPKKSHGRLVVWMVDPVTGQKWRVQ